MNASRFPAAAAKRLRFGTRPARGARRLGLLTACFVVLGAACPEAKEPQPVTPAPSQIAETDSQKVARLEREARALAKVDGCTTLDQCRAAPVGERPCGGPRDYVVYCHRSTDSSALYRKLAELQTAEVELNRTTNAMSTCEFRTPPEVVLSGGSCRSRQPER